MGLAITATVGFSIWVCLWALGVKSFDGLLVTMVILVLGAAGHIIGPKLPGARGD